MSTKPTEIVEFDSKTGEITVTGSKEQMQEIQQNFIQLLATKPQMKFTIKL